MTMVFCANIVLAIFNRIQRSFLVEQHLKCSSEVGDFVMSQLISFPEMGKKKKKARRDHRTQQILWYYSSSLYVDKRWL